MSDEAAAVVARSEEFRADVADFDRFVERGRFHVGQLEELAAGLQRRRAATVAAIGHGLGPPDTTSPILGELIAEAALANEWVDAVRTALITPSGRGHLHFGELRMSGHDRPLVVDRAALRSFRQERLVAAGLGLRAAQALVDDPPAMAAALTLLGVGVRPRSLTEVAHHRLAAVAGAATAGVVVGVDTLESLLGDDYDPNLRRAVLSGRLPAPDDALRNELVAALEAGLGPGDVGIDPAYFPAPYRRHHQLSERIVELERSREVADGSSWAWWDSDDAALAEIDRQLAALRSQRSEVGVAHAIDSDRSMAHLDAVAQVASTTGGARWEGRTYGADFNDHHEGVVYGGGLFGANRGSLQQPTGFGRELTHIANRLADDPEVAVAFYNTLGVGRAAALPTFVAGADLDRQVLQDLGRGLGRASRVRQLDGSARLDFGGDDLLGQPRPDLLPGVIGYSPALLFTAGRFDDVFLSDAALTALSLAHQADPRGVESHWGAEGGLFFPGSPLNPTFNGGEDPRNILLARAAENTSTTALVMAGLEGSLAPLLQPRVPFGPTIGSSTDVHWLDELRSLGNVSGPEHSKLGPLGYPDLADPYPITGFLDSVAGDDELSRLVLEAVATGAAEGPMVQDPGTAAGLDLILARHATVMFDPADLAAVGIERTGLNDGPGIDVRARHWKAVHHEVLRLGRGQALAAATGDLLLRSIEGAFDDRARFEAGLTRPFAHMAARTEAEAHEALFAYAAQLDDTARQENLWANRSVSAGTTALSFVPGVGLVGTSLGVGWTWFFEGYPVDAELTAYRESWDEMQRKDLLGDWEKAIASIYFDAVMTNAGSGNEARITLFVPGGGAESVRIRRTDLDDRRLLWEHPASGEWSELPPTGTDEFLALFYRHDRPVVDVWRTLSSASVLSENHQDGRVASDADWEAARAALTDGGADALEFEEARKKWDDAVADAAWTWEWLGGTSVYD